MSGSMPSYISFKLSNGYVALTSGSKYNLIKHPSLSLISSCVTCQRGKGKAGRVPRTNKGEGCSMNQLEKGRDVPQTLGPYF